jgi:hypothetical protein
MILILGAFHFKIEFLFVPSKPSERLYSSIPMIVTGNSLSNAVVS